ncbi:MAG: ATP-dependent DNA helicase RecG [Candidatus Taylorbacteria bacterium]|nr:ATP-dependent DNA helicase RecG [Candidatus Taylorbacteria bacterium]
MTPTSTLKDKFRLTEIQHKGLKKLGLHTIEDLLYYFPLRHEEIAQSRTIASLKKDDVATVYGKVTGLKIKKTFKSRVAMSEATIEDETGKIKAVWFHQPYIAKIIQEGAFVKVDGKVSERKSGEKSTLSFTNPEIESIGALPTDVGDSLFKYASGEDGADGDVDDKSFAFPVYGESKGITSRWLYHTLQKVFRSGILDTIEDPIPVEILEKYSLPTIKTAFIWIHAPQKKEDSISARKRFAFQEIFIIQLEKFREKKEYETLPSFKIEKTAKETKDFVDRFPFTATDAQNRAIEHILEDFKKNHPMSRLLEGDVGSGKTAVAAATVYAVTTTPPPKREFGNLQTAYMVPTEILAEQHFESFIKFFSYLNINVGLITSSGCKKFPSKTNPTKATDISRTQLLKWVAEGTIPILIGTHSLIAKTVKFKNLAYIIIDEQHRFGTAQRKALRQKDNIVPHLLSMTATPIPRTLALTIYGDLDLTLLDQMPHGRKPVITEIILPSERDDVYEKVRKEIADGRQAYIICPRIFEPDPLKELALNVKSVTEEAKRIEAGVFSEYKIGILHSKMKPTDKDSVMMDFKNGDIHILVATSVVEVGVNVPNATVIIIEGAERFGLAQLHQLRGRVLRSSHQSYCYVFAETKTQKTLDRLKALKTAKNGFELAEFDLAQRGAGELYGRKQWGISDLAMEAIKNIKMVEAARHEAEKMINKDPQLKNHPLLKAKLIQNEKIHFE